MLSIFNVKTFQMSINEHTRYHSNQIKIIHIVPVDQHGTTFASFKTYPHFQKQLNWRLEKCSETNIRSKLEPLASLGFLRKMLKLAKAFHENQKDRDELMKPPNISQHYLGFCKKQRGIQKDEKMIIIDVNNKLNDDIFVCIIDITSTLYT